MGFEFKGFIELIEFNELLGIGGGLRTRPYTVLVIWFVLFGDGLVDIHAESAV